MFQVLNIVFSSELDIRVSKGYLEKDIIHLVVEDPKTNVGSGGATINALLSVVEYMSARRGFTVGYSSSLLFIHQNGYD